MPLAASLKKAPKLMLAKMTPPATRQKMKRSRTNAEAFINSCLKATEHNNDEDDNDTLSYKNKNKETSNKCFNMESKEK